MRATGGGRIENSGQTYEGPGRVQMDMYADRGSTISGSPQVVRQSDEEFVRSHSLGRGSSSTSPENITGVYDSYTSGGSAANIEVIILESMRVQGTASSGIVYLAPGAQPPVQTGAGCSVRAARKSWAELAQIIRGRGW